MLMSSVIDYLISVIIYPLSFPLSVGIHLPDNPICSTGRQELYKHTASLILYAYR